MDTPWGIPQEEDDDFEDEPFLTLNKDTILFCIDASPSMQKVPDLGPKDAKGKAKRKPGKSHFHQALQCALDVMKRKVIICPNDSVGIMFFNTEEKKGDQAMDNNYLFLPVSPLSSDSVLAVMEVLDEANEDPESLRTRFAPKEDGLAPIGDVFASCNHVLRAGAPKTAIKRIFYITDEDSPGSAIIPAGKRLEDLVAQGITLVPFFISTDDKPFDVTNFYSEVLTVGGSDDDAFPFGDVCEGFEQVIAEMRIREMPKRAMWSIPMEIAEGLTIGIKGYGLVTEQKKPAPRYVAANGATTEEVVSKVVYIDKESHGTIPKIELLYGNPVNLGESTKPRKTEDTAEVKAEVKAEPGSDDLDKVLRGPPPQTVQRTLFTGPQVRSFRTLDLDPGIKVLGFKDSSELQFEDNTKHAYFLYPDEAAYTGSTRTFTALLKSLLKQDKIGICRVTMRINSSPLFCALVPQEEKLDENQVQLEPPGFHLIPLPFADEIREPPVTEAARASSELVECATQLIKKMTLKKGYQPDSFPNPALAMHFAFVEANALGTEFDPDVVPDTTLPAYERIHSKAGPAIQAWREQLENEEGAQVVGKPSRKRALADANEVAFDESEIRARHEDGTLNKLTNAIMKDYLKHRGQKVLSTAKKADLVAQLADYLDAH